MDDLEQKCKKAVISIEQHVKDINFGVKDLGHKFSYFLQNYREDYYTAMEAVDYRQHLKDKP